VDAVACHGLAIFIDNLLAETQAVDLALECIVALLTYQDLARLS